MHGLCEQLQPLEFLDLIFLASCFLAIELPGIPAEHKSRALRVASLAVRAAREVPFLFDESIRRLDLILFLEGKIRQQHGVRLFVIPEISIALPATRTL